MYFQGQTKIIYGQLTFIVHSVLQTTGIFNMLFLKGSHAPINSIFESTCI